MSLKDIYYNPYTQVILLGFVCFMGPGMFNALNGLGGAGQLDATTSANANTAVYATFAVSAFFSGSINNKLGSRTTLFLGTIGYALYIAAFLALNNKPNLTSFVIAAGAIDGLCAGPLWTAQGSLMLAYPTESQKGRFIGLFWTVYNIGGVLGAAVSLGRNFHSTAGSVDNGTYIGFLVLSCIGVVIPLLMANPAKMVRSDGSRVSTPVRASWKTVLLGIYVTLKEDPAIFLLFPMFFASNWFYTWQFNDYNGALFTIRARSLNNLMYWLVQMIGSVAIGRVLDTKRLTRRVRAFAGWMMLLVIVFVVHVWGFFYQRTYTRESVKTTKAIDIHDKEYAAHLWLYIFCALLNAMWQTATYWMMGAMSNDPAKLAFLTGFYKSIQSAGAAGVWRADAVAIPYMNIFLSTWILLVAGLLFMLPMLFLRVTDHTPEDADGVTAVSTMDEEAKISPKAE
ncbi:MFS general substrate transporter [Fomitiporia mediterranea MF3/22]|uniref:MFS general substrate transporter n=1 Tax=Fomitiporia mediterranea (strain MF3/22) TaxID=694068 RepID=UPI00044084B1|nr:MFS general substrate transporter [Fomitiporia mediterranea MF3/22]EJD04544.1 MFS general substrate transporter [Fomitiporia mediterranea MF3/22]